MSNVNNYIEVITDQGVEWRHFFHNDFADGAYVLAVNTAATLGGRVAVYRIPDRGSIWDNVGSILVCEEHKYVVDQGHVVCKRCNCYPKVKNEIRKPRRRVVKTSQGAEE